MWKQRRTFLSNILLPILGAIYPVIFLYSHNVKIILASSIVVPLLIVLLLALVSIGLFWLFERSWLHAALSAFLFLIFFHTYGILYSRLLSLNIVQVEHYTLLPLVILVSLYGAYFITKLRAETAVRLQTMLILLTGGLIVINMIPAIPAEIGKAQAKAPARAVSASASGTALENAPDIYYVIFDEYAGFEALHEYWKYDGYQEFISFLEDKGFYVADKSRSFYTNTLYEMTSRLNLRLDKNMKNPLERTDADFQELFDSIANNKVMRILKSYGYTTVVFDGARIPYPTKTEIVADYNFAYEEGSKGGGTDEFSTLFYEQTMIRAFPAVYEQAFLSTEIDRKMVLYSLEKVEHLEEVPTPRFVYLHLMLPHLPILFDENGGPVDYKKRLNWNYYLGQHKYATKRAKQLVSDLLKNADPNRPPVIILQSDHGARSTMDSSPDHVGLKNYPEKDKTSILNAMLLPGYDYSKLTKDLSPIEPLAIVLNYYLHAGVKIEIVSGKN